MPPNLSFQVDDVSQPWTWGSNAFDFVHLRFLVGCFTDADWSGLYKEAYNALKPGGWIEHTEWSLDIRNDEQSLDPIMLKWRDVFIEAGPKTGRSFEVIEKRDGWLKDAGFPEITKKRFQLPLGDWPADPKLKEIGKFNLAHINIGLDGYARFLCETVLGWKPEEVTVLVAGVRRALKKRGTYFYMWVFAHLSPLSLPYLFDGSGLISAIGNPCTPKSRLRRGRGMEVPLTRFHGPSGTWGLGGIHWPRLILREKEFLGASHGCFGLS